MDLKIVIDNEKLEELVDKAVKELYLKLFGVLKEDED